jgi:hypothetical protein
MGLTTTSFIVSIQSTVSWQQRGIATAANMFMRNLGNTIGAALLGGILNIQLVHYISSKNEVFDEKITIDTINVLLSETERNKLSDGVKTVLQDGLTFSLHSVYYVVLLFAIISLILVGLLPKKDKDSVS